MEKGKTSRKPVDFILVITILLLVSFGIIIVLSASAPTALAEGGNSYSYGVDQLIFACMGIGLMSFISFVDYRIYKNFSWMIYWGVIILMLAVPLFGYASGGAQRWISIFGISFQPSEVAKIGLIIFFAAYISEHKDTIKEFGFKNNKLLMPFILLIPILVITLGLQNHFSATLVMTGIVVIMIFIGGARIKHLIGLGVAGIVAAGTAIYIAAVNFNVGSFRLTRITSFLDPWADPTGDGWQIIQSLYAIGSGGLFGVGLGDSKQKYLYLSEPHNDFIFAIVAEELGFLGCLVIILLFAILIWRGIKIAIEAPNLFGTLLATGITSLVAIQVIINIGVVISLFPVTGMPLPFFSYGGTALIILLSSMGILLNISKQRSKM